MLHKTKQTSPLSQSEEGITCGITTVLNTTDENNHTQVPRMRPARGGWKTYVDCFKQYIATHPDSGLSIS